VLWEKFKKLPRLPQLPDQRAAHAYAVYTIINKVTGKKYCGRTAGNVHKRFRQHLRDALKGGTSKLHRDIQEYGLENFSVAAWLSVNKETSKDPRALKKLESIIINLTDATSKGLNDRRGERDNG